MVRVTLPVVSYANLITKVLQDAGAGDMPNIMLLDNPNVSQAIWTAIQVAITGTWSVNSALRTAQGTISGVQQVSGG